MDEIYNLSSQVVLEAFDDSALVLRLKDRHLFELNQTAREILIRTSGQLSVGQIAVEIAQIYQLNASEACQDVLTLCEYLLDEGIIKREKYIQNRKEG